jgi:hypothetical protein
MSEQDLQLKEFLSSEPLVRKVAHLRFDDAVGILKVSDKTYRKLRQSTPIHYLKADLYAIRLGLHPYEIWGEEWLEVAQPSLGGNSETEGYSAVPNANGTDNDAERPAECPQLPVKNVRRKAG